MYNETMNYGFEVNNSSGKWTVTLASPIPADEQGWKRVRRSEALVRDALEKLLSEPPEVARRRMKRLEEEAEQITFLDLLDDESVKNTKAETRDRDFLEMIYDLASEYATPVIAKYIGLPEGFIQSLAGDSSDKLEASPNKVMVEIDATSYRILASGIRFERSNSVGFMPLIEAVYHGYLGDKMWLLDAEKAFKLCLDELEGCEAVIYSPNLAAITFRNMERIKLSLKDAVIVYSHRPYLPSEENKWKRLRAEIQSPEGHHRLIEVAIWILYHDLFEDLSKIAGRFSKSEEDDEYYRLGKGNLAKRLEDRIAREIVFNKTVGKSEDRLIYLLRRAGYSTPEIKNSVSGVAGRPLTRENIRQRYKRTSDKVSEKLSKELSQ